jgi:hypothetical protein
MRAYALHCCGARPIFRSRHKHICVNFCACMRLLSAGIILAQFLGYGVRIYKERHPARCRRAACFGAAVNPKCLESFDHASRWIGVLGAFDTVVLRRIVKQKALPPKYILKHRWTCFNLSCRIVGHDDCEPVIARRNYISGTWRSSS